MLVSCGLHCAQQMDQYHDSKVGTLLPACGHLFMNAAANLQVTGYGGLFCAVCYFGGVWLAVC